MTKSHLIPTAISASFLRDQLSPRETQREFARLTESVRFKIAGIAKNDLALLNEKQFQPKHKIDVFDTRFYFTDIFQIPDLRFFVGYVVQSSPGQKRKTIYPRIIYKDLSLAWRSASHFTKEGGQLWVGKGDVRDMVQDGYEMLVSDESTTDLPLEMQTAVEKILGLSNKPRNGKGVLELILRQGPDDRIEPYQDFSRPRQLAAANKKNLINRARPIATFTEPGKPQSLVVVNGFQPDFANGVIETSFSKSKLYGGRLKRFRILSMNRKIQYYFVAGAKHVWMFPPQALTTELSSYGVRTVDVEADDDLFIPGYEYHHYETNDDGEEELYSQIPEGFAGEECPADAAKADASAWLDKIPMIAEFRKIVLGRG